MTDSEYLELKRLDLQELDAGIDYTYPTRSISIEQADGFIRRLYVLWVSGDDYLKNGINDEMCILCPKGRDAIPTIKQLDKEQDDAR